MRKACKFRLYPTRKQAELLVHKLAAAQRLYNAALEQRPHRLETPGRLAWLPRQAADGPVSTK